MSRNIFQVNQLATLGLVLFSLIQIAHIADIFSNLPIEYDQTNRLKIFSEDDVVLRGLLQKDLIISLIAFFFTTCLVGFLELTGNLTRTQKNIVFGGAVISALLAVFIFPLTSTDMFLYISYGHKLGILGLNPYETTFEKQLSDPVISQIPLAWPYLPTQYGPIAVASFAALSILSKQDPLVLLVTFKLFFALLYAGSFFVAKDIIKKAQIKFPVASLFSYFGNPSIIYMLLIEGHIDGFIIFLTLICYAAYYYNRMALLGFVAGLSCGIKITTLVIVPIVLVEIFRTQKKQAIVAFIMFFIVIFICYMATNGSDLKSVYKVATNIDYNSFGPIPQLLRRILENTKGVISNLQSQEIIYLSRKLATLFVLISLIALFVFQIAKGTRQTVFITAGSALMVTAISMNWFQPWYILWGLNA